MDDVDVAIMGMRHGIVDAIHAHQPELAIAKLDELLGYFKQKVIGGVTA